MLDLTIRDFDGEPRMRDLDIAEALEFSQPRDIRKLIQRNHEDLEGFGDCVTVTQTPRHGGAAITEYWLNEEQALFLCTRSEARGAVQLTKQMVMVFAAWRNGRLDAPRAPSPTPPDDLEERSLRRIDQWLATVREARLIGGPTAAQRVWMLSPLPQVFDERRSDQLQGDDISSFFEECCICSGLDSDRVSSADLSRHYGAWRAAQGLPQLSMNAMGRGLAACATHWVDRQTQQRCQRIKSGVLMYVGLRLVPLE